MLCPSELSARSTLRSTPRSTSQPNRIEPARNRNGPCAGISNLTESVRNTADEICNQGVGGSSPPAGSVKELELGGFGYRRLGLNRNRVPDMSRERRGVGRWLRARSVAPRVTSFASSVRGPVWYAKYRLHDGRQIAPDQLGVDDQESAVVGLKSPSPSPSPQAKTRDRREQACCQRHARPRKQASGRSLDTRCRRKQGPRRRARGTRLTYTCSAPQSWIRRRAGASALMDRDPHSCSLAHRTARGLVTACVRKGQSPSPGSLSPTLLLLPQGDSDGAQPPSDRQLKRALVVPMHGTQRVRPVGASVDRRQASTSSAPPEDARIHQSGARNAVCGSSIGTPRWRPDATYRQSGSPAGIAAIS